MITPARSLPRHGRPTDHEGLADCNGGAFAMSNQGATVTEPEDPQAVEADTAPVDTTDTAAEAEPASAPTVGADGVFVSPPADEPTQL